MTNYLLSFLVSFLIGLGLGDSHLVIPLLYSLALFFFVISAFYVYAFTSFFVLSICWCYFAFSNFFNIHLSYLSKKKKKKESYPKQLSKRERDMPGCLNLPNYFLWKNNGRRTTQLMIKRVDFKIPILCQLPSQMVTIIRYR